MINTAKNLEDERARSRKDVVKEIVKFDSSKRSSKNERSKSSLTEIEECKEVEKICGVQLDMTTSIDGTMTVIIKGSSEKVKEARRELVMRLGHVEKTELQVARSFAGYVIGTGRKQLIKIEEKTNTKINVRNDQVGNTIFTIRGEPMKMREARNIIQEIVSEQKERVTKNVNVPKHLEMFVFGANREKFDEWRKEYGVFVKQEKGGLVITGKNDRVVSLCDRIVELCRQKKEDSQSIQLDVEKRRFNQLLSDRRTVNQLLSDVMNETTIAGSVGDGFFVLTGKVEKMGEAMTMILTKIHAHVFEDMEIPMWIYKRLKNKILPRHSYHNGVLTIDGPPDVVEDTLEELKKAITEISSKLAHVTVAVNHKHHSRLIGRKGMKVRDICNTFNVEMNFPGNDVDQVYLEGSLAAVEAARKHILQFVDDIENETCVEIMIYRHLHEHIKTDSTTNDILKSFNVHASFQDDDMVVLKGNSSSVSECAAVITRLADQLSLVYGRQVFEAGPQLLEELKTNRCKQITTICDTTGACIRILNSQLIVSGKQNHVNNAIRKLTEIRDYNNSAEKVTIERPVLCALVHNKVVDALSGKYGVKIEIQGEDCVITGDSGVDECKKELLRTLGTDNYHSEQYKPVILRSAYFLEDINEIEGKFGVFVSHREMTVVGKNAEKAVEMITKLASKDTISRVVQLDEKVCNNIFNMRTVLRQRIEKKYAVCVMRLSKKEVEIVASKEQDIKDAVESLKSNKLNSLTQITLPMEKHQIGEIIGPNGSRIRSMEERFAVKIDISNKTGPPQVVISGLSEDVEEAKIEILNCLPVTESLHVDAFFHSHLIGVGGCRVSEMREKFKVAIKFDTSSETVTITGSPKNVQLGISHVKELVDQLLKEKADREANSHTKTINIKSSYAGRIIGKKGTNISNLRNKFNVSMSMDGKNEDFSQLSIVGSQENVERAYSYMSKMVESMESEVSMSINVPFSIHPILIGKGGRRIKDIMNKYNVNISFSKTVDSLVLIVGSAENANECANYIESIVDDNINSYSSFTSKSASLADYL